MPAITDHAVACLNTLTLDRGYLLTVVCACGWASPPCYSEAAARLRHTAHVEVVRVREKVGEA